MPFRDNKSDKPIMGMIHVQALPGTPNNSKSITEICQIAEREARIYKDNEVDAIIVENMHDIPYLNRKVGPEIIASMSVITRVVKQTAKLPCGIQILAGANKAALAVAQAANLDFIRAEGFVFSHIADEGQINSDAAELMRYRKYIEAKEIAIFTDIKKKHSSHAITSDISISDWAKTAEFFLSDGLIITGTMTGEPPDKTQLTKLNKVVELPIIIGSGISSDNIDEYWNLADGFIVGSDFKNDGKWFNTVDEQRVLGLVNKVKELRMSE